MLPSRDKKKTQVCRCTASGGCALLRSLVREPGGGNFRSVLNFLSASRSDVVVWRDTASSSRVLLTSSTLLLMRELLVRDNSGYYCRAGETPTPEDL